MRGTSLNQFVVDVTRRLQCVGMNRQEAEDARALRERTSDPLRLESCAATTARDTAKRRQRIGGVGIQLRHVQKKERERPMYSVGGKPTEAKVCLWLKDQRRTADSLPLEVDSHLDAVGDCDEGNTFSHPVVLTVEGHCPFNLA